MINHCKFDTKLPVMPFCDEAEVHWRMEITIMNRILDYQTYKQMFF